MTNTQLRVISALILIVVVGLCLYFGKTTTLLFLLIAGIACVDEIFVNFFKRKRIETQYFFSQVLFVVPFVFINFSEKSSSFLLCMISVSIVKSFVKMRASRVIFEKNILIKGFSV